MKKEIILRAFCVRLAVVLQTRCELTYANEDIETTANRIYSYISKDNNAASELSELEKSEIVSTGQTSIPSKYHSTYKSIILHAFNLAQDANKTSVIAILLSILGLIVCIACFLH